MSDIILNIVEIVISAIALYFAYKAFRQSVKARRYSSFESIFAQMLSVQRSFFENQHMLNAEGSPLTDEFVSMFVYLINHKDEIKDLQKKKCNMSVIKVMSKLKKAITTLMGENLEIKNSSKIDPSRINDKLKKWCNDLPVGKQKLSIDQLTSYYRSFNYDKSNVEYFKNSFKFIYNIVTLVEKAQIEDTDKQLYIDRIQALLNRNEMFCYFVNLVEYHKEFLRSNNEDETHYISRLEKYKFFKDLDDRDGRFHEILERIDSDLLGQFGIEIENRQK